MSISSPLRAAVTQKKRGEKKEERKKFMFLLFSSYAFAPVTLFWREREGLLRRRKREKKKKNRGMEIELHTLTAEGGAGFHFFLSFLPWDEITAPPAKLWMEEGDGFGRHDDDCCATYFSVEASELETRRRRSEGGKGTRLRWRRENLQGDLIPNSDFLLPCVLSPLIPVSRPTSHTD